MLAHVRSQTDSSSGPQAQPGRHATKFLAYLNILCKHSTRGVPNQILLLAWIQNIWPFPKFWTGYATAEGPFFLAFSGFRETPCRKANRCRLMLVLRKDFIDRKVYGSLPIGEAQSAHW